MRLLKRLRSDDSGFTLPELVMYSLLLTIVLAVAAGIMMSGTIAERTVRTVFGASTAGQLTADSIETGVRNSSGWALSAPTPTSQLLVARVAQGTTTLQWNCAAWYYSPTIDGGSIWYKTQPGLITTPTTAALKTWSRLAEGVKPAAGTKVFSISGDQLVFAFDVAAGDDPPASVASSSTSRSESWVQCT